ncbi:DUF58 domain-containing protein [Actinotalea sp. M2MS4P-6]|uniref:DUF58 domain-containing protein n=1 Tax=Actinotalea sp. M2MS4P-6 TaxID=2983762 RepID=UPI0021E3AE59|nr:DUF58 domain-containing protein [Actinotalea sp. M2MS4P-6]MCV2393430.1 DUF58 domain-containing protein [Actinotalea sp. M2MS4P-6]
MARFLVARGSRLGRLRPTTRGLALLGGGVVTAASGVALGVPALVLAGLVATLAVVAGAAAVVVDVTGLDRHGLSVHRTVVPHPVTVGERATVGVEVRGRAGLDHARLSERAARELSGGRPLRAKVSRSAGRVELRYTIDPTRRGRWPAGPLEVHLADVLGTVRWSGKLGPARRVAVRPRVTALSTPGGAAALDTRAATGARSPAPDDLSLRDYRPGDDPRRVHWRSTARLGDLVVRQDERAGRRPATVLLDLPTQDEPLEWTISVGVSIAIALVDTGHRVRMLAGEAPPTRHRTDALAVESLLDQAVDLVAPPDAVTARSWLLGGLDDLTAHGSGTELVIAVVGALDTRTRADLARIGAVHEAWAMVRTGPRPTPVEADTLASLRRAGWHACRVTTGEPATLAWHRLLETAAPGVGASR